MSRFATQSDYEVCRALHRQHGTTYYLASRRFPRDVRQRVDALYGFVRVADEWVDNPGTTTQQETLDRLEDFADQYRSGLRGRCPSHPAMRALVDVVLDQDIDRDEPLIFLASMAQDVSVDRYPTYDDLRGYMRGSAVSVGLMMCQLLGAPDEPDVRQAASSLAEAMQLTNILRDIREDLDRGRVYIPLEDLTRFGVCEGQLHCGWVDERFEALMRFQIDRARRLYAEADSGIPRLPRTARPAVRSARILYSRILDRIEAQSYDVFRSRARTSRLEKLAVSARCLLFA